MCGKALPFRRLEYFSLRGYASADLEAKPPFKKGGAAPGKPQAFRTSGGGASSQLLA